MKASSTVPALALLTLFLAFVGCADNAPSCNEACAHALSVCPMATECATACPDYRPSQRTCIAAATTCGTVAECTAPFNGDAGTMGGNCDGCTGLCITEANGASRCDSRTSTCAALMPADGGMPSVTVCSNGVASCANGSPTFVFCN